MNQKLRRSGADKRSVKSRRIRRHRKTTDRFGLGNAAQCAAVQAKINDAAAKRKAALEARRAKRDGGAPGAPAPAPAPGTPEAEEEAAADAADAAAFLAELEAAVQGISVDTNGAVKELEDAKARLLAGVGAAGGKCKSGLEARLVRRSGLGLGLALGLGVGVGSGLGWR